MHFAALIEPGVSMLRPELYFQNNAAAALILFEAMLKKNVKRLVLSSTAAVYGEPEPVSIREQALLPHYPYGGIEADGGENVDLAKPD